MSPTVSGGPTPTGTVTFWDGTNLLGTVTLSGGTATLTTSAQNTGTRSFTATYGGDANYTGSSGSTNETITPAPLTITADPVGETYGGGNTFGGYMVSGLVAGDSVLSVSYSTNAHLSGSGHWAVGTWTISIVGAAGAGLSNYTISYVPGSLTVTPMALTSAGVTVADKVYDGTTAATITAGSLAGAISGDDVVLDTAGATANFADPNVGPGKPVTVTGCTLGGGDAGDYTLTTQPTGTAAITPAALTITANDVDMTYGGGNSFGGYTTSGLIGGDTVSSVSYSTDAPTTGSGNWAVGAWTITPASATGTGLSNYTIGYQPGLLEVDPKELTVTGVGAANKVYDGTTTATVTGTAALSGVVSGDAVSLDGTAVTADFDDPLAAIAKPVTVDGYALSGTDASNYVLTQPTTTANITPAPLTVTGFAAANKVYDGTTAATITSFGAPAGTVSGDSVDLDTSGVSAAFVDPNVGTGKTVTSSGYVLTGPDAGNYYLTAQPTTTADILPYGTAQAVDDNYQLSDDGTFAVAADEGVLNNDVLPSGPVTVALDTTAPPDPGIASLTLNADGGFNVVVTAAANASAAVVSFVYDVLDHAGAVIGSAVVKLQTLLAQVQWFNTSLVSFDTTRYGPIYPDNGGAAYATNQYVLPPAGPGGAAVAPTSNPIFFVRNTANSFKIATVKLTPIIATNVLPQNYTLSGEVYYSSGAGAVAAHISLQSAGTGTKDGNTWKFTNVQLTATSDMFNTVSYMPNMMIVWTVKRTGVQNTMKSGQSTHPAYVTFAAPPAPGTAAVAQAAGNFPATTSYKLLRSFIALGSDIGDNGDAVETANQEIAEVWAKFSGANVTTWDGTALVYYANWAYVGGTSPLTKDTNLVSPKNKGHGGDCTSFATLFLDALKAQGVLPTTTGDLLAITPTDAPQAAIGMTIPVMFVGSWAAAGGGVGALAGVPGYTLYNSTNAVTATAVGWKANAYNWSVAGLTKTAPDPLRGQNNATPLGIFGLHYVVDIGGTIYDPSYGTTAANLQAWQNAAIPYTGLRSGGAKFTSPTGAVTVSGYIVRPTSRTALSVQQTAGNW